MGKLVLVGMYSLILCNILIMLIAGRAKAEDIRQKKPAVVIGAYYFDGWAGRNRHEDDPKEPWAVNAPTHLTRRMLEEFPEREPLWGWRDDSIEIMERQIDLASDHGLSFFAFDWYWHDNGKAINLQKIKQDPLHTCMGLYLKAKNNNRLKFCLLVANHQGYEIKGTDAWKQAADFWMQYLTHPQAVRVDGKPLIIIFNPGGSDENGLAYLQESARKAGLAGVAVAGCSAAGKGYTHRTHYNYVPNYNKGKSEAHSYAELVQGIKNLWHGSQNLPYIPLVSASFDKRPWDNPADLNQETGWYFPDRTPGQFAESLREAVVWMGRNPEQTTKEHMVVIYAWNELGEGGYLVPTKGDPKGKYLQAIKSVSAKAGSLLLAGNSQGKDKPVMTPVYADRTEADSGKNEIKIDGKLDDWASVNKYTVNDKSHIFERNVFEKGSGWKGTKDCSYSFSVCYDSKLLYFGIKVKDNHYHQEYTGDSIWENDCIEMFFDTDIEADRSDCFYSKDDFHLLISVTSKDNKREKQVILINSGESKDLSKDMPMEVTFDKDGYNMEGAIPWDVLNNFKPVKGNRLGFNIAVDDADESGQRKFQMGWRDTTLSFEDPSTFGEMIFK